MLRVQFYQQIKGVLLLERMDRRDRKKMFKESEDKYTRIHGMEKRRWLRCEIIHQKGQR
jgi:hypothetical protein